MRFLDHFVFAFLEWCIAIPVIFHSLNGGRLILYELFHVREEEIAIRSLVGLGFIYAAIVGFFFLKESPQISATLFWSIAVAISLLAFFVVIFKVYLAGHDSKTIILRMQSPFIKGIDFVFIVFLLFHAGHGLFSIIADYIKPGPLLKSLTLLIVVIMAISVFFGIRLVLAL